MRDADITSRELPTRLYLAAIGIGVVMLLLLLSWFPARLHELRRTQAMLPVVGTVDEHREVRLEGPPGRGRGGRGYPSISRQAHVTYHIGEKEYDAWVEFGLHLSVAEAGRHDPNDPRPKPGETVHLWYHPQAPAEPTANEPQPWGDLAGLVLVAAWNAIFVGVGVLGLIGLTQRTIAWYRQFG